MPIERETVWGQMIERKGLKIKRKIINNFVVIPKKSLSIRIQGDAARRCWNNSDRRRLVDETREPGAVRVDEADFCILHTAVTRHEIVSGDGAIVDEGLLDIVEADFFGECADFADVAGESGIMIDEILNFGDIEFAEYAGIGEGWERRGERDEESAVWEWTTEVTDGGVEGE